MGTAQGTGMEDILLEPSLVSIKAILVLDNDGNRLLPKYYDKQRFPDVKEQTRFEKLVFKKTVKANSEIIMLEGLTILYRSSVDLFFYVVGSSYENELLLLSALDTLFDSLNTIEKKVLMDNLDIVMLALDELCDNGILMECDPEVVAARAQTRNLEDLPLGEQTVAHVQAKIQAKVEATSALYQSAKEQLK